MKNAGQEQMNNIVTDKTDLRSQKLGTYKMLAPEKHGENNMYQKQMVYQSAETEDLRRAEVQG